MDLLGLSDDEVAAYRAVLARPTTPPEELGLDPATVARLAGLGLLRGRSDGTGLVPQRPDVAAEPLLAAESRRLADEQERLARARREVNDLLDLYVSGAASSRDVEVERVEGPALGRRLDELVETAVSELLTIGVTGALSEQDVEEADRRDLLLRSHGVRMRTVQPSSVRDVPHLLAYGLRCVEREDPWRVVARPPLTMLVIDRAVGLVPVDQDAPGRGAFVVWSPAVVRAFVSLFELLWDSAEPLVPEAAPASAELSERERRLLRLLGAGVADEAAARQLGLGLRTVRRDVAGLLERLGARNRFQAGAEAARRGWV